MQKFNTYLKLECKRILRLFPGMIIITLLILLICGIIFLKDTDDNLSSKDKSSTLKTLNIGLVYSDEDRQFLGLGFYMLEHADDIGYICKFRDVSLSQGQKLLENEQLDVLAIFPDDYVMSVYYGIDEPITLRFGTAQSGISSLMFKQLSQTVSDYMMEAKAGTYAMQDMYDSWNLDFTYDADSLAEKYVMRILDRTAMIKKKPVNATDGLSPTLYYVCVGIVLVLLFWGLNCGSVLGNDKKMLSSLLLRQNLSKTSQYFAKYISLTLLFAINYFVIASVMAAVTSGLNIDLIPPASYFKLVPLLLLLSALVLFVYEISHDGIGGMLFFFFSTLIMGFLSGFFYPLSYFPLWMQNIARFLPTRIMFEYAGACIKSAVTVNISCRLIICTIIFIVLTNIFSGDDIRFTLKFKKGRRLSK